VHAHPYFKHQNSDESKKSPASSHHHTPGQYFLLSFHIIYFASSAQVKISYRPYSEKICLSFKTNGVITSSPLVFRVRPPPVMA
jgi:hypothetical protein